MISDKLIRRHPFVSAIALLVLLLLCSFAISQLWGGLKVIDPKDPRFDPASFRFEDYAGLQSDPEPKLLTPALLKMFPPGTPIEYIDAILVDGAGATKQAYRGTENAYRYSKYVMGGLTGWVVIVHYDDHGNSVSLRRGPSKNLYNQ